MFWCIIITNVGGDLFPFSHFGILIPTIKHFTNVRDFMNWGVFGWRLDAFEMGWEFFGIGSLLVVYLCGLKGCTCADLVSVLGMMMTVWTVNWVCFPWYVCLAPHAPLTHSDLTSYWIYHIHHSLHISTPTIF